MTKSLIGLSVGTVMTLGGFAIFDHFAVGDPNAAFFLPLAGCGIGLIGAMILIVSLGCFLHAIGQ